MNIWHTLLYHPLDSSHFCISILLHLCWLLKSMEVSNEDFSTRMSQALMWQLCSYPDEHQGPVCLLHENNNVTHIDELGSYLRGLNKESLQVAFSVKRLCNIFLRFLYFKFTECIGRFRFCHLLNYPRFLNELMVPSGRMWRWLVRCVSFMTLTLCHLMLTVPLSIISWSCLFQRRYIHSVHGEHYGVHRWSIGIPCCVCIPYSFTVSLHSPDGTQPVSTIWWRALLLDGNLRRMHPRSRRSPTLFLVLFCWHECLLDRYSVSLYCRVVAPS